MPETQERGDFCNKFIANFIKLIYEILQIQFKIWHTDVVRALILLSRHLRAEENPSNPLQDI